MIIRNFVGNIANFPWKFPTEIVESLQMARRLSSEYDLMLVLAWVPNSDRVSLKYLWCWYLWSYWLLSVAVHWLWYGLQWQHEVLLVTYWLIGRLRRGIGWGLRNNLSSSFNPSEEERSPCNPFQTWFLSSWEGQRHITWRLAETSKRYLTLLPFQIACSIVPYNTGH